MSYSYYDPMDVYFENSRCKFAPLSERYNEYSDNSMANYYDNFGNIDFDKLNRETIAHRNTCVDRYAYENRYNF